MKKTILLLFAISFIMFVQAAVIATVNVPTAGTLTTALTEYQKSTVTDLTITGYLDARDFTILRDNMPLLTSLDISAVTINAFTGLGGTAPHGQSNSNVYYANEIPTCAFHNTVTAATKFTFSSVLLPISITSIGSNAFYQTGLISVIIPNNVVVIYGSAFNSCSNLSSVVLSSSLELIESGVFNYCRDLKTIYCLNTTPPTLIASPGYYFPNVNPTNIYVPTSALSTYLASPWNLYEFSNKISANPSTQMPNTKNSKVIISSNQSSIIVDGVSTGEEVSLFSANGLILKSIKSNGQRIIIPAKNNSIYILKTEKKTFKVAL